MAQPYQAPLPLIQSALAQSASSTGLAAIAGIPDQLGEVADSVLESAARFAREILSPLNQGGDRSPARCGPVGVVTSEGFAAAYQRFRHDGWTALGGPSSYGGHELPTLLTVATGEMWAGANLSFAMCPELAVGAIEALAAHAAPHLRDAYLPPLVSGEWTAAMCLTEPEAGSDLAALRTRAVPDGDSWRLFGRKIYISWGDHDLTDNIVHLVLARAADAPPGLKGISLFLVPKRVPAADGKLQANDIHAVSVEHKMGIRASPTCVMALGDGDGARGWLVGNRNEGLACMFTMMNQMRLGVGMHSLGLAERALQLAREHAHERLQGRNAAGSSRPIIEHTDVRRMLLAMKALTHAARCLVYQTAATLDVSRHAADDATRAAAQTRLGLLTPVVKAWCSELAVEVASLGVQIHGGTGYVDDAEISQIYRDARIGPIFEGTNYIQAQDLLGRKIIRDRGAALAILLDDITRTATGLPDIEYPELAALKTGLTAGATRLRSAAEWLIESSAADQELIGATACHLLQWLGVLAGGWQWALAAHQATGRGPPAATARALLDTAAFYAVQILPRMQGLESIVRAGSGSILRAALADL